MANALALYKFDLSKEGFQYLSSMGVTVSHTSLHKKLNEVAKKMVSAAIQKLKEGLQNNCVSDLARNPLLLHHYYETYQYIVHL